MSDYRKIGHCGGNDIYLDADAIREILLGASEAPRFDFSDDFTSWVEGKDWMRSKTRSGALDGANGERWAVIDNLGSENKKSILLTDNATATDGVLSLAVKKGDKSLSAPCITNRAVTVESEYTSSVMCSTGFPFGRGRLDVRAKLPTDNWNKTTIWATTDKVGVKDCEGESLAYGYELDIAEYTPADSAQGSTGTSRGMWAWQLGGSSRSLSTGAMHFDDNGEPCTYNRGLWWQSSSTGKWLTSQTVITYNGNKVADKNGRYFIVSPLTSTGSDRSEITVRSIMNGKDTEMPGGAWKLGKYVGGGAAASKEMALTGIMGEGFSMGDWHVWSVLIEEDERGWFVAYLCDGKEYWRRYSDELYGLGFDGGITYRLIFSTSRIANTHKADVGTLVDYVRYKRY